MSKANLFIEGEAITLSDLLSARDMRQQTQLNLLERYPNKTLVSMTMNIPGEIKTNTCIETIHSDGLEALKPVFPVESYLFCETYYHTTGIETYILLSESPEYVKKEMVKFESIYRLGKLFDIDILEKRHKDVFIWSRKDIGVEPRQCYICSKNAKECGRSRTHSIQDLQIALTSLVNEGRDKTNE